MQNNWRSRHYRASDNALSDREFNLGCAQEKYLKNNLSTGLKEAK